MRCPDCRSQLTVGSTFCDCGWRAAAGPESRVTFRHCHFEGDGRCRYDRDRANKYSHPVGATVRINDYWICNYHYENGYDRRLRAGEHLPVHEMKIQSLLFDGRGSVPAQDVEALAERAAIQEEGV